MDIICWNNSYSNRFFTARKRSLGQGNIFSSVSRILFTGGGGVPGQVPPWAGTPHLPGQVHPPGRYTPLGRYTPRQIHCPGRYTPRQVAPPWSSACWEIRATSRRYASYWNAFLFLHSMIQPLNICNIFQRMNWKFSGRHSGFLRHLTCHTGVGQQITLAHSDIG